MLTCLHLWTVSPDEQWQITDSLVYADMVEGLDCDGSDGKQLTHTSICLVSGHLSVIVRSCLHVWRFGL